MNLLSFLGAEGGCQPDRAGFCRFDPEEEETPVLGPGEQLYTNGQTRIIADQQVPTESLDFYFESVPKDSKDVLQFFGMESPWKDHIDIYLINKDSPANSCATEEAPACAGYGMIQILCDAGTPVKFNQGTQYHELSHALRKGIASFNPKVLEEGLAFYTEMEMSVRKEWRTNPTGQAAKIYEGELLEGETLSFLENAFLQMEGVQISHLSETGATLTYRIKWKRTNEDPKPGTDISMNIPLNHYYPLPFDSLLLRVQVTPEGFPYLTIYQRAIKESGGEFIYADRIGQNLFCSAQGYYDALEVMTENGPIAVLHGSVDPYVPAATDESSPKNHGGILSLPLYKTGFCFWDMLRKEKGHSIIQKIVLKMVSFSRSHPFETVPFPFFQTFVETTGMSQEEAKAYFDRFYAPNEDGAFPIGSVCW